MSLKKRQVQETGKINYNASGKGRIGVGQDEYTLKFGVGRTIEEIWVFPFCLLVSFESLFAGCIYEWTRERVKKQEIKKKRYLKEASPPLVKRQCPWKWAERSVHWASRTLLAWMHISFLAAHTSTTIKTIYIHSIIFPFQTATMQIHNNILIKIAQ